MAPSSASYMKKKAPGRTSSKDSKGPPLAQLALDLTSQEWSQLSLDSNNPRTAATDDLDVLVERVTALLLVRIVACVAVAGTLPDASTTMICKMFLDKRKPSWPSPITDQVLSQLKNYVTRLLTGYQDVPYHNRQHAYHVIVSVNKLVDMMACCHTHVYTSGPRKFKPPPSFGLRNSPIAMLGCLFAALIHDVEHQGIPNRQLSSENDRLAVLYNDQSIAENWSLYIAFSEFLQDEFLELREVLFGPVDSPEHPENYKAFRKMVVSMVMSTDIACPVRTQVSKSKWKEAFGEPHETVEAKLKSKRHMLHHRSQQQLLPNLLNLRPSSGHSQSGGGGGCGGSVTSGSSTGIIDTIPKNKKKKKQQRLLRVPKPDQGSDLSDDDEEDEDEDDFFAVGDEGVPRETPSHQQQQQQNQQHRSTSVAASSSPPPPPPPANINSAQRNTSAQIDSVDEGNETSLSGTPEGSETDELGEDDFDQSPDHNNNDTSYSNNNSKNSSPNNNYRGTIMNPEQQRLMMVSLDNQLALSSQSDHPGLSGGPFSLHQFLNKSERRLETRMAKSTHSVGNSGRRLYRQRLGILRTVDLGGETLETYSRHTVTDKSIATATIAYSVADLEQDEPNELKMIVVMETILTAADVAHNLQSWEHMVEWSRRLYLELRRAHVLGRGPEIAASNWFENQISFLESYMLPLARRLEDTGVWGDEEQLPGKLFAHTVEAMRDEWIQKGNQISLQFVQQGKQYYPLPKKEQQPKGRN